MSGLQKQTLPISFSQGVDTKTDSKQVMAGKLISLENGIFKTAKEIRKRFGFTNIPNAILGGGSISSGVNISSYNNELTVADGSSLYSYSQSTSDILNKGALPTTAIDSTSIVRNSFRQIQPDSAKNGNIQVFAWNDSSNSGNIRYSVVDVTTGQTIVNNQQVSTFTGQVKVMAVGNFVAIFYLDSSGGTNLFYKFINVSTPTTLSAQQTLASDSQATYFDCTIANGRCYVGYENTSHGYSLYYLDAALIRSSQFTVADGSSFSALNVFADATGNIWGAYGLISSGQINVFVVNSSLTTLILTKTTLVATPTQPLNITGIVTGTTATIYYCWGPINNATQFFDTFSNQTNYRSVSITGTLGTESVLAKGIALASKAFIYSGIYYVVGVFATIEQSTYFVLNQNGLAIAKFSPTLSGGVSPSYLPEVNLISSGTFQFASLAKDLLVAFLSTSSQSRVATGSSQFTLTGVQSCILKFTLAARPKLVLGDNLLIGGGIVWSYDGVKPVEQNFNIYPEGIVKTSYASGSLGIGSSTASVNQVQYSGIYEWTDNEGQIVRSATSIPLTVPVPIQSVAVTANGNTLVNDNHVTGLSVANAFSVGQVVSNANFISGTYVVSISGTTMILSTQATATSTASAFSTKDLGAVSLTIPTLRLTAKSGVQIILYRTVNNGTIFYRLNDPSVPLMNDSTVDSIVYLDTKADASIIGNEQLYTTGGELDNNAPPAVSALISYRNRAIYLTPESPNSWGYSKQVIPGSPVEFSDFFTESVDSKGGGLSAIAEMDDKLVLYKPNSIYYVAGEGPSPSGLNNDFSEAQFVSSDTGCNNQASLVLCPIGLMFQSPKGIYLLGRNLQVQYIGAEVEAYNSQTVTSAQLITTLNQVRFTMDSGVCLVYDYYFQQWSVFTNINAVDSTIFQNQFSYISPVGLISQENPNVFTDNGDFIQLKFQTSWFSFAGVQGFQRIYRIVFLGDYKSPHYVNVGIQFDFDSTVTPISQIPYLSNPGVYQFEIQMPRQKCEAMSFTLQDSQNSPFGEGLSLSAMSFEVGLKAGPNRIPAARSYG